MLGVLEGCLLWVHGGLWCSGFPLRALDLGATCEHYYGETLQAHTHSVSGVCVWGRGGVWLRFAVNASAVSVKRVCSTEILLLNTPLAVLVSVFSLSAALEADREL